MKNNTQGFNMEEYNEFLKKIKAGSPVHKINFTLESPNAVAGMYLITIEDPKTYLDKIVDHTNLKPNTLLVFESRHVIECCQIIYGCLNVLKGINVFYKKYEDFINDIITELLTKPIFYYMLAERMNDILIRYIDTYEETLEIRKKFIYILKNIWFVPYGQIDEIAKEAIEEFKKNCGDK